MKNSKNQSQALATFNFDNASPEALDSLLNALNAEVDQAILETRLPTLDGAFQRFGILSAALQ